MKRYSNEELRKMSDLEMAIAVCQSYLDGLVNPNSPLAAKLRCTLHTLKTMDTRQKTQPANCWSIMYIGSDGQRVLPDDLTDGDIARIQEYIRRGFTSGELEARESCHVFHVSVDCKLSGNRCAAEAISLGRAANHNPCLLFDLEEWPEIRNISNIRISYIGTGVVTLSFDVYWKKKYDPNELKSAVDHNFQYLMKPELMGRHRMFCSVSNGEISD